jgi:hypothetical protein
MLHLALIDSTQLVRLRVLLLSCIGYAGVPVDMLVLPALSFTCLALINGVDYTCLHWLWALRLHLDR